MITLKLSNYEECEALALQNILEKAMENHIRETECGDDECQHCVYARLCKDLSLAVEYVTNYNETRF